MKLVVLQKIEQPIYEQLYSQIVVSILSKEIEPDFCLPSIRGVAKELGISVITVKSAYEMLERDGYIYTCPGKGCFVSGEIPSSSIDKRLSAASTKLSDAIKFCRDSGFDNQEITQILHSLLKDC